MKAAAHFARQVLANLERQHTPLLVFHLFFSVLAATLLLPAMSWIMTLVLTQSGERAISNHELTGFALSPVGLLWILTGGTLFLLLITLQRAGMIVIAAEHEGGPAKQVATALVHVARKFPRLFRLALIRATAHILLAAPFLLAIHGLHATFLGEYTNDFVMREKPPSLWLFLACALPFAAAIVAINGTLYVRWLLALPCVMLEHTSVRGALRRSHRLVSGWRWRLALKALALAVMVFSLPVLLVFVFDRLAAPVLRLLPDSFALLVPATLAVLALYILFAFVLTFLGVSAGSLFLHAAHRHATGRAREPLPAKRPRRAGLLSWSVEILLVLFSAWQAGKVLDHFRLADDVAVIAHRGSSLRAPENSIAAIERAIHEGADYLEIDVRQSADGTPVLLHDRDLERVAGVKRSVSEITDTELADIDIGSRVSQLYAGERVPTLGKAIEHARGRIVPFVDIKTGPQTPTLVRTTIETLREQSVLEHAVIGASTPAVLREVQQLAPGARTALFIHFSIGSVASTEFDILGVRASTVTSNLILRAHRNDHEVFVFTVNGRGEMSRFIDMGVDGIITDRPALLRELLAERAALSESELLVVKLRHWLRN